MRNTLFAALSLAAAVTATVVASILVFFGSGYQNIVLPFQMSLVGSLAFGLGHLLLADHDGPVDRRDAFGLAAGWKLCAKIRSSPFPHIVFLARNAKPRKSNEMLGKSPRRFASLQ